MSSFTAAAVTKTLLRVTVSRRGASSHSLMMLDEFTQEFMKHYGNDVKIVDWSTFEIGHLDYDELEAGRTPQSKHSPEMQKSFELANILTDEIAAADHVVIATPMYNWGMPSSLKAWFDRIINTRTFYEKTTTLKGIPMTIIIASGGPYSADATNNNPERMKMDYLRPHLIECLIQMSADVDDIQFINIDPTGPIDGGRYSRDDPNSGTVRGRQVMQHVVARSRATDKEL
jgi:FMN-dependent NADH-azoreductase